MKTKYDASMEALNRLEALYKSAQDLNQIVEGVRCQRWVGETGGRFKDTSEWTRFYVALKNCDKEL